MHARTTPRTARAHAVTQHQNGGSTAGMIVFIGLLVAFFGLDLFLG